jgi:hypothetical protein
VAGPKPSSMEFKAPYPDQVLENVLQILSTRRDRNAASLVCKSWCRVEALIGNRYSVEPRPDFNLMPLDWGAHFALWVNAMAAAYPWLEKVYLQRMSVSDDDSIF